MTEIYIKCKKHKIKTHIKEIIINEHIIGECGCHFLYNSGYIKNLTIENKEEKENETEELSEIEDYQRYGARYQDGSREKQGRMLPDGSYI